MLTRGAVLLRRTVEAQGLSQIAVATTIGVSQSMVSDYLRARKLPTRERARVIQAELGIASSAWDEPAGSAEERAYFRVPKGAKRLVMSGVRRTKKARPCRAVKPA